MWDKSQLLRGIVRAGLCMLTLFSPAEQAQAVLLKWVEPPCRSEGCCLLTLTPKQSLSDPPHLNYQHNSDYSCILCMELQLWGSPGHYPRVACVIWIPPPLCGYKCTRAEEQGAESHPHCNRGHYKQSKINICSRVKDFHSSPINGCMLFSGPPFLIPGLYLLLQHTAIKAASGPQAAAFCELPVSDPRLECANLDVEKMPACCPISVLKG